MNSYSISFDLISEILSRLPAKSVARFRCVSKLWASILGSPYFKKLFLTMSSAKPRLLFAIGEEDGVWSFFSLPQLQNPYEKSLSTLVVAAEFHWKFSRGDLRIHPADNPKLFSCGYASGLIYFSGCHTTDRPLVCNPNTGRYVILPYLKRYRKTYSFVGFEPIGKQYKVLFMAYPSGTDRHNKILTLGTGDMMWRTIKFSLPHQVKSEGVCINGVLYYLADRSNCFIFSDYGAPLYVIVCFDIRYEKFTFINIERFCRLINYHGKLAVTFWDDEVDIYEYGIYWEDDLADNYEDYIYSKDAVKLRVWVLEVVEKQEWSKYSYTLKDGNFFSRHQVLVVGVTDWGEIVFAMCKYTSEKPFYVFYFNPEKSSLRRVEIQGFGETFKKVRDVWTFVNHVENLNVNDLKLLKIKSRAGTKRRR